MQEAVNGVQQNVIAELSNLNLGSANEQDSIGAAVPLALATLLQCTVRLQQLQHTIRTTEEQLGSQGATTQAVCSALTNGLTQRQLGRDAC